MPVLKHIQRIDLTTSGGTYTLPATDGIDEYLIYGSGLTMLADLFIVPSGSYTDGLTYIIKWKANIDTVTNSTAVTIFGQTLTSTQVTNTQVIECIWDATGTAWDIQLYSDFLDSNIIDASTAIDNRSITAIKIGLGELTDAEIDATPGISRIANDAVTTAKILDANVTTAKIANSGVTNAKLANDAVDTANIVNLAVTGAKIDNLTVTSGKLAADSVITSKILDSNVTTAKVADGAITTVKIADGDVTDAKLATWTPASLKYGDAAGAPGDLALGADEIAIGNGTTIVAVSKTSFLAAAGAGTFTSFNFEVSFEAGEVDSILRFYLPFECWVRKIKTTVIKDLAGTDDGTIDITDSTGTTTMATITIPMSTSQNTVYTTNVNYYFPSDTYTTYNSLVTITPSKTTAGGKAFLSIIVEKI